MWLGMERTIAGKMPALPGRRQATCPAEAPRRRTDLVHRTTVHRSLPSCPAPHSLALARETRHAPASLWSSLHLTHF